MLRSPIVLHTDDDGDRLTILPRDHDNPWPDPVITVTSQGRSQSVFIRNKRDAKKIIAALQKHLVDDAPPRPRKKA